MRIVIIGAGKLGSILARELSEKGHEVIVVDVDEQKAKRVAEEADVAAYVRDATDPAVYDEIGLQTADVLVAVTGKDEVNLFAALIAREYGVPRVIAKVRDSKVAQIMNRVGLTESVIVEPQVTASLIKGIIEGKYSVVELVPAFIGGFRLVTITVTEGSSVEGQLLEEIKYPREGVKILAIYDGEQFLDPAEVVRLQAGYQVIALVREDLIDEFLESFR